MFRNFRLDDIFEVSGTKFLDAGKLKFVDNGINFVGRTNENNGVQGKISEQKFAPNEPNTITATVIGNYKYVKFQTEPYYCSQNINKLKLKSKFGIELNYKIALYLMTYITNFVKLYNGQQSGYKLADLTALNLKLPVTKSNNPDFKYMERVITVFEKKNLATINNYLTSIGLNDYKLTSQDKEVLKRKPKFNKFKVGASYYKSRKTISTSDIGVFDIIPTKKKINANMVKFGGNYPYVARGEGKNGIRGYINYDPQYLNVANTISFGQDTATINYQPKAFFTGDKIQILKLNEKYGKLTENTALYLIGAMKKAFTKFSWGASSFAVDIIANVDISLPVDKDNAIDFNYMENYIRVIQKINIKNTIKYIKSQELYKG